jgi:hypothetical protein
VRRGPAFHDAAKVLVARHASRADGTGRFVNDRAAPRRKPKGAPARADAQLSFDL